MKKVSYVTSICVVNDAISEAVKNEIVWLEESCGYNVKLYAYKCDFNFLPFKKVGNINEIIFDEHFQTSDLTVFHFGIFFDLFDSIAITPQKSKRLVVFHNITPKQFVHAKNHSLIDKSFGQVANILFADRVICDSGINLDALRKAGIKTPAAVLPLAVSGGFMMPESKPSFFDSVVRIVFIGRFVRSKGPGDLLSAVDKALRFNKTVRLILDMVGNLSLSDDALVNEIIRTVKMINDSYNDRIKITLHGNADDITKQEIFREADLFVLPTYHEGFCVPVLEALSSGCRVIVYDNSNTSSISGGFARLVPTGGVNELSSAIAETAEEIISDVWRDAKKGGDKSYSSYSVRVSDYVRQYSPEQVKRKFLDFIKELLDI